MKCTLQKRLARVGSNFGISFLTPLIGINISNSMIDGTTIFIVTVIQAVFTATIYTGLSVATEVKDWSESK